MPFIPCSAPFWAETAGGRKCHAQQHMKNFYKAQSVDSPCLEATNIAQCLLSSSSQNFEYFSSSISELSSPASLTLTLIIQPPSYGLPLTCVAKKKSQHTCHTTLQSTTKDLLTECQIIIS
jgi:hypothetical protein